MVRLFVFGLGYTGARIAAAVRAAGGQATGTGRAGLPFTDGEAVRTALRMATHVLSSVPPAGEEDPVLAAYGDALGSVPGAGRWLGYLSSTGVYGDAGGAWVDEGAPLRGRRGGRLRADAAWAARGAHVFRLPGIYGPGRSALERVAAGTAHRVGLSDQVFSRVHVDDIVGGVVAALGHAEGTVWNLADDNPAAQDTVVELAARLLGLPAPPVVPLAALSPASRAFYAENRRVANGRAKRGLGWRPRYADYVAGLTVLARAASATASPVSATAPPATASGVHR